MLEIVRKVARTVAKVGNTCINPACLHSTKTAGCACCKKGCGAKKGKVTKSKASRRKR